MVPHLHNIVILEYHLFNSNGNIKCFKNCSQDVDFLERILKNNFLFYIVFASLITLMSQKVNGTLFH